MDNCVDWWNSKRKEISILESTMPLDEFYMWPPVVATMWTTTDGYALNQVPYLTKLPDWETRWLPAIRDRINVTECQWWPKVSFASIGHAYTLAHFETITELHFDEMDYIFEFGAGTGNVCRIIHNLGFMGRYEICDFPEMQMLQRFFISESGVNISNIHWVDSMDDIVIPNSGNRLLISMSSIEEATQDIHPVFIELGKRCTYFLTGGCLWNGTHVKLRDETKRATKWLVWDTLIPPGYYIGIGIP